jgi:hypothetical protein
MGHLLGGKDMSYPGRILLFAKCFPMHLKYYSSKYIG